MIVVTSVDAKNRFWNVEVAQATRSRYCTATRGQRFQAGLPASGFQWAAQHLSLVGRLAAAGAVSWVMSLVMVLSVSVAHEATTAADHLKLRNETAMHYTTAQPHLQLARWHYDRGHKVMAFRIAEWTRKLFGDDEFTPAFAKLAAITMNSLAVADQSELEHYAQRHPGSVEARYLETDNLLRGPGLADRDANAVRSLEALLADFPDQFAPKARAAKYFLKVLKDPKRALPLYLDLYFANPHYYDGEYAESRIKGMVSDLSASGFKERGQSGMPLGQWVLVEQNPVILGLAIEQARKNWDASLVAPLFSLLDNDDPAVQTAALHTLLAHPGDVPKERILQMLNDEDLIRRGMAAMLLVNCLSPAEYPMLEDNLASGIDLVQIDTVQALVAMGGTAGAEYLKAHPPVRMSARVKSLLGGAVD